ncbi:MAG TPA: hypothetical protein VLA16_21940, partial [Ideonella sp.]|nr:hypothetical protein [Ideonella sp.]
ERTPGSDGPTAAERAEYRRESEQQAFGVARVERLPLNLGYIDLRGFVDLALAGEAIAAAMTLVAHTGSTPGCLRPCRTGLAGEAASGRQTALRCRSMQVSRTSPPSRFHQFCAEKISTSL